MTNSIKKWAKDLNSHLTKEDTDRKQAYENTLNIICHQGNA